MPATWDNYAPSYRPATEEDVFASFQATKDHSLFFENLERPFGPQMNLYDWSAALEDPDPAPSSFDSMHAWLAETYLITVDKHAWRELVSEPASTTINDICRYVVAQGAKMLDPVPVQIAGRSCQEAGVFLTMRSSMSQLTGKRFSFVPSTTIDRVAREDYESFYKSLIRLSPRHVDALKFRFAWLSHGAALLMIATLLLGLLSLILWLIDTSLIGFGTWAILFGATVMFFRLADRLPPRRIEIHGLRTMAELAREIARH